MPQYLTKKNIKRNISNFVLMRDMFDDASEFNQKLFWDKSGDPMIENMFIASKGSVRCD